MTNGIGKPPKHLQEFAMFVKNGETALCSGGEEDYAEELHSPTDSSEDSVEVKVSPVSGRSKRKCSEPRKFRETAFSGPLKKRMCLQARALEAREPFRPWSVDVHKDDPCTDKKTDSRDSKITWSSGHEQAKNVIAQPLSLVKKSDDAEQCKEPKEEGLRVKSFATFQDIRVPIHPQPGCSSPGEDDRILMNSSEVFPKLSRPKCDGKEQQRNYKNMTRERRIEANARERTRVHTISAAFETLRRSVPSYSHNQKLSKLSVLRIACAYIMSLSNIVNEEIEGNSTTPSLAECVETVTRTIQKEGKLRKKKEEGD